MSQREKMSTYLNERYMEGSGEEELFENLLTKTMTTMISYRVRKGRKICGNKS